MNPIVLGALISAGPVLAASALGAWATVRTAQVSAGQTELTLAADHARWLRDKQSDVYVAMIRLVQDATMHRVDVIRYIEFNLNLPVGDAFKQATEADLAVWNGLAVAVESAGPLVISADLSHAVDLADRRANDLYQTAYEDLASVNLRVLRQQGQGKPRGLLRRTSLGR
jgi:hypothetical protein